MLHPAERIKFSQNIRKSKILSLRLNNEFISVKSIKYPLDHTKKLFKYYVNLKKMSIDDILGLLLKCVHVNMASYGIYKQ